MGVAERRQREKKERRCCILDAAERVFLHKGLTAATMEEIAQEAEVSKGTLYLYFKGKDDLYLTIAVRALAALVDLFEQTVTLGGTGLERVERLLQAHVRFALVHTDRFRIATSWVTADYSVSDQSPQFSEYRALVARIFERGVESIELGKQDGSLRSDLDSPRLAVQLWGATLGLLTLQLAAPELSRRMPHPLEVEQLAPTFSELLLRAIRAETPS
jgi:TetR/AcrR family transcriptional regulator